jgi:5-methylcytosine-specific restriction endonuclease McrA
MKNWSLAHVPDHLQLREMSAVASRERVALADVLAHIAEVDARRLYLPAAYPSMYHYCVGELRMSEDAACRRTRAARVARDFPAIFELVADGRLNLTALTLLAPHLSPGNATELLAAAAGKDKAGLERLLAEHFPQSEGLGLVQGVACAETTRGEIPDADEGLATGVTSYASPQLVEKSSALARMNVTQPAVAATASSSAPEPGRLIPIAAGRYELRATIDQATHDKLRKLQALLSHAVPSGDLAEVLGRAFDAAIQAFEKRRYAKRAARADDTDVRPARKRPSKSARHIPADVRRAVHERDGARCSFVSATGRRCEETRFLQFDHILPLARGGTSTVENLRLRCRAHNQYEAERMFGAGFMAEKRASARGAASARASRTRTPAPAPRIEDTPDPEVVPWLLALGFKKDEANRAATLSRTIPDAPLEARFKIAVRSLAPKSARKIMPVATAPVRTSS